MRQPSPFYLLISYIFKGLLADQKSFHTSEERVTIENTELIKSSHFFQCDADRYTSSRMQTCVL
jgi:hypothetical protein